MCPVRLLAKARRANDPNSGGDMTAQPMRQSAHWADRASHNEGTPCRNPRHGAT